VGASCAAEDTRPYFYGPHNDTYDAVVRELGQKSLTPYTKIVWADLENSCTGTYEKIRIAYQRALLGDRLTNISVGGSGVNVPVEYLKEIWAKRSIDERRNHLKSATEASKNIPTEKRRLSAKLGAKKSKLKYLENIESRLKQLSYARSFISKEAVKAAAQLREDNMTSERKRARALKSAETRRKNKESNNVS
jgi:hypothetical protein